MSPGGRSTIVIGTRGSRLALIQTESVIRRLRAVFPSADIQTRIITTRGDKSAKPVLGEGVFAKELQDAITAGEIDAAVHSLKDLPAAGAPGTVIAAIPERADPRDALVGGKLDELPKGARIGTDSPRRAAQLRRLRDDLVVVPIRGNVPTRIEKVRSGEYHAAMLAMAGLGRLGIEADEVFGFDQVLPAPGQGALAVEIGEESDIADEVAGIDDSAVRPAVTAERELLQALGGGCLLPVGAYARMQDGVLVIDAVVVSADGKREARTQQRNDPDRPNDLARDAARALIENGARELL